MASLSSGRRSWCPTSVTCTSTCRRRRRSAGRWRVTAAPTRPPSSRRRPPSSSRSLPPRPSSAASPTSQRRYRYNAAYMRPFDLHCAGHCSCRPISTVFVLISEHTLISGHPHLKKKKKIIFYFVILIIISSDFREGNTNLLYTGLMVTMVKTIARAHRSNTVVQKVENC